MITHYKTTLHIKADHFNLFQSQFYTTDLTQLTLKVSTVNYRDFQRHLNFESILQFQTTVGYQITF